MTQKERLVDLFTGLKLPEIGYDGEIYLGRLDAEYMADYLLFHGVVVLPPVNDMLFDAYLYETDKLIIEHYLKETGKGLL